LALPRRTAPVLLVAVLLAGCASAAPAAAPAAAPGTPAPSAAAADDQVVVALDDFAALAALAVGVTPDLAFDAFGYESTRAVLADVGVATAPYGAEVNLERVVAARPDVIVGVSLPTTAAVEEQLDAVAPTTVVDYTATWEEQLDQVAAALGREQEAAALTARLREDTAALAADLEAAGLRGAVVSVLGDNQGWFAPPSGSGVGSVLTAVGLARPAAQEAATDPTSPFVTFSPERLTDHDGDQLFLFGGGPYTTGAMEGSPLFGQLRAVQEGAVHEVSGEVWLSTSPFGVDWVLRDLRATLLEGAPAATAADAAARYRAFAG
jgi:iron complex transport system substrate-binding protein